MITVAFGHEREVGKDTAVGYLVTHLRLKARGKGVRKASCAFAAKEYATKNFPLLKDPYIYDENRALKDVIVPEYGKTPRQIWQDESDRVMKENPLFFLDLVMNDAITNKVDFLIISDLRNPGMAVALLQRHAKLFKITRDVPKYDDPWDRALDYFPDWHGVIDNNCSFRDLEYQMEELSEELIHG